jgi:hypothetical protein
VNPAAGIALDDHTDDHSDDPSDDHSDASTDTHQGNRHDDLSGRTARHD